MSAGDWIVLAIVLLGAALALRGMRRHHGCGCGACGDCDACKKCKKWK